MEEKKVTAEKAENAEKADPKTEKTAPAAKENETKPAAPAEPKKEKKEMLDDIDDGDLILEDQRESVPLTPQNARFTRSRGGLVSLDLIHDDGSVESFERVVILRAFPVSNPDEFLSVREPDTRRRGRGKEIGMVRYLSDFDADTVALFREEIDRRYFSPTLLRITAVKEKFGYSYWDAETSAGHVTFVLNNPFNNIRMLEDGRVYIYDIDGNCFEIPDPKKLDPASFRRIEIYL